MAIEFIRRAGSDDLLIRVTHDLFRYTAQEQYVEEMQKAIREFIQTDPEVRLQINGMVRTAFGQVDLLKLVTDTIKQSLPTPPEPVKSPKEAQPNV
jgi:hypothetical protein